MEATASILKVQAGITMKPCAVRPQTISARGRPGQMKESSPRILLSCWALQEVRAIHRLVCALETMLEATVPFPSPWVLLWPFLSPGLVEGGKP